MSGESAARCPACGKHEVRHEFDLGCEICEACGHVLSERALSTAVQYDDDGAQGVFLHDGATRGQHLAAARSGLAMAPGATPSVARAMFRDEASTHLANISRSVDFAAQQLRLTKDASADARALVMRASEGRWGEGDWTTLLVGACVYCAARQNQLPIAMRDVAEACQLDVFALGRVYTKLKRMHDVVVPPLDPDAFVARAAAAVPELTAASIRVGNATASRAAPASGDLAREATRSPSGSRSGAKADANAGALALALAASRAKDLAPLVNDAKCVLGFARRRGLTTGRNPVPFVGASVFFAAASRGVALTHDQTAAAARATKASVSAATRALREELVRFTRSFEWGRNATSKTLRAFLPSVMPHIAAALRAVDEGGEGDGGEGGGEGEGGGSVEGSSRRNQKRSLAREALCRVEAMPLCFRAHEKTRLETEARLRRAKDETLAALGAASAAERPPGETEILSSDPAAIAVAVAAPSAARTRAVRAFSRGGVRSRGSARRGASRWDRVVLETGIPEPATNPNPNPNDETRKNRNVLPAAVSEGTEFDWSDVALQRLLLEGVPEAYLVQEKAFHPPARGATRDIRTRDPASVWNGETPRNAAKPSTFAAARLRASDAARRVRRRVADETEHAGRDFLLGGTMLPGGVTWKAPDAKTVERYDRDAVLAIPDAEIADLLRTPDEVAFARAVAESALGNGRRAGEDQYDTRGEDGERARVVPVKTDRG